MLLAPQTRPHDAFLPPETKPSTEPEPQSTGWGGGLGGWGLDAVRHVAAVALS